MDRWTDNFRLIDIMKYDCFLSISKCYIHPHKLNASCLTSSGGYENGVKWSWEIFYSKVSFIIHLWLSDKRYFSEELLTSIMQALLLSLNMLYIYVYVGLLAALSKHLMLMNINGIPFWNFLEAIFSLYELFN